MSYFGIDIIECLLVIGMIFPLCILFATVRYVVHTNSLPYSIDLDKERRFLRSRVREATRAGRGMKLSAREVQLLGLQLMPHEF